jgi:hypothetical protein
MTVTRQGKESEKKKKKKKTCPISSLSTTNPAETGLESRPGLHSERITKLRIMEQFKHTSMT